MPDPRKERALATRRRVLRAAYALFSAHGYERTTMEAIAEKAGVAVQTLYFTFRTKGAILEETVGACVIGFDLWEPIKNPVNTKDPSTLRRHHDWWPAFEAEPDARAALVLFVDASMDILGRVGPIANVVHAAAAADPSVRAMRDVGEQRRVDGYEAAVAVLAKKSKLAVTKRRARDILLVVLSAETYEQLTVRREWTARDCRQWFVTMLGRELFDA